MAVIEKDLGPVSAYAVAVAHGYTGTEAEWEALIANSAINAQSAGASATAAAASAQEAAQQKTQAQAQAMAAQAHATQASNFANTAGQANSYAQMARSNAAVSAANASNAQTAAEAAQAAAEAAVTGAEAAQIAAEAAVTDAQTAKTAAETAAATAAAAYGTDLLADDYSTSKTYAVGDYVIYSGNLYRCTTAITTAEAWTAAHWTQAQIGPDVSDLKSASDAINDIIYDEGNAVTRTDFSGGQNIPYTFTQGQRYYVSLKTYNATSYQIGTVTDDGRAYVDDLSGLVTGNADTSYEFVASGASQKLYIYMTPSTAKCDITIHSYDVRDSVLGIRKHYSNVISNTFVAESDDWTLDSATVGANGLTMATGGSAFNRKPVAFDDFIFSATFKPTSADAIVALETSGSWRSRIALNVSTQSLVIYNNYNDGQTLVEVKSVLSGRSIAANRFYKITLFRDGWNYRATIEDVQNQMVCVDTSWANYDGATTRTYPRVNGYFGVACVAGMAICTALTVYINHKHAKCLIIGDSLTEGDQVANKKRWAYRIKNDVFLNDAVIAAAGGDSANAVKTRLQSYINLGMTFDMCIVLCGMNNRYDGGTEAFQTAVSDIYNLIVAANAMPIIMVNPIPASGADYIHAQRSYITSKGWDTVRLDYAFSTSYAHNAALFNSDGIHPNDAGNDMIYSTVKDYLGKIYIA